MATFRIAVTVEDTVTPFLSALRDKLRDKRPLNAAVAVYAEQLTRDYLRGLHADPTRHATAARLGAAPTGHFLEAADSVRSSYDEGAAVVSIGVPGFGRAFGDVKILPKRSKALTIPVHPEAYGRRAREFSDLYATTWEDDGGNSVGALRRGEGDDAETLFILMKSVTQPKDATLLPSPEAYGKVAELAARQLVAEAEAEGGAETRDV